MFDPTLDQIQPAARPDDAEFQKRIDWVKSALIDRVSCVEITAQIMETWNVGRRTAQSYIQKAKRILFRDAADRERLEALRLSRRQLDDFIQRGVQMAQLPPKEFDPAAARALASLINALCRAIDLRSQASAETRHLVERAPALADDSPPLETSASSPPPVACTESSQSTATFPNAPLCASEPLSETSASSQPTATLSNVPLRASAPLRETSAPADLTTLVLPKELSKKVSIKMLRGMPAQTAIAEVLQDHKNLCPAAQHPSVSSVSDDRHNPKSDKAFRCQRKELEAPPGCCAIVRDDAPSARAVASHKPATTVAPRISGAFNPKPAATAARRHRIIE